MEFYFKNSFLEIGPYTRNLLIIVKEGLSIVCFIFSLSLIFFAPSLNLKFFGLFLILVLFVQFLRRNASKEDVRFAKEKSININDYLTKTSQYFLINIITKAEILNIKNFEIYLLKQLLKNKKIQKIFLRLDVSIYDFSREIEKINFVSNYSIYEFLIKILSSAFNLAKDLKYPYIDISFIFFGLRVNCSTELNDIFEQFDLKKEFILSSILMEIYQQKIFSFKLSKMQPLSVFQKKISKKSILNRALTSKETNVLDAYSIDLTYLANMNRFGFLIGHQKELEKIIDDLKQRNNVLLIGDEGSGKETIIMHLAWLIQNDLVSQELLDFRLVKLDLGLLYAQSKENFLPLLTKILDDVLNSGYIILYLPYLENILLDNEVKVMQIMHELLISKSVPVIATMSNLGYQKSLIFYNLDQFFEKVEIIELSESEAIYLLTLESLILEKEKNIIISPSAISLAVSLSKKLIRNEPLPKSAREVISEAIVLAEKNNQNVVNNEIIQEVIAEKTKIPVGVAKEIEKEKLLNLENLLHQKIVDQNEAIEQIAKVLKIYRAGLEKKKGPIGTFLFVGPTGVGKTETAKVLAKIYYGSEKQMIRLDMVEFQNPEDIDKLIGSKDGNILGSLTEPVLKNPFSLILLDEFEKTHPTIMKLFLPLFDEGFIKDGLNREIDFKNTLIICTSNAHADFIKDSIEKNEDFDKIKEVLKSKLSEVFSVELLNRFDEIVIYKPLKQSELLQIAKILIDDLKAELLLKQGIDLEISPKALDQLVFLGTDPIFGARHLNRKVNEIIRYEIANLILANKLCRGNKIFIDFDNQFQFLIN